MAGDVTTSMRGKVIAKQSIYDVSVNPLHSIGDSCQLGERVFYYAKNGGVQLGPGLMAQSTAQVANHINLACPTASVVGDKFVWVTLGGTAVTVNQYSQGYIHINDVTTVFAAKIKSHAAQATTTGNVKINLYDPIPVATTTGSKISLSRNIWDSVIVVPNGGITGTPAGVSLVTVPIGYYFWAQTWGPAPLLTVGTIVVGGTVGIGGTSDGACGPVAAATAQLAQWGTPIIVNATTKTSLIYLTIAD